MLTSPRMRYMFYILCLLISFVGNAAIKTNELKRIAKQYIVNECVMLVDTCNPSNFWRTLIDNNVDYLEIKKAAQKGRAREIQREIGNMVHQIKDMDFPGVNDDFIQKLTANLEHNGGVSDIYRSHKLQIIWSPEENAYSFPDGTTNITIALAIRLNYNQDYLMAVYAHEMAHFVLQHQFSHLYSIKKRKKRDNLIASILSGLTTAANSAASFYAATNGAAIDWENTAALNYAISSNIKHFSKEDVCRYSAQYSRDQEFEADIVAYSFLQWIGIGGDKYIEMLKLLQDDLEIFHNDESTHPLTTDRIRLLENLPAWKQEFSEQMEFYRKNRAVKDDIYSDSDSF